MRAAVLTVSDGVTHGTRQDESGEALAALLAEAGWEVVERLVVADERVRIAEVLRDLCDSGRADLVLSTGGTGFAPRDVTPEATLEVLERLSPGIDQALRADSLAHTPHGMLSRGVSGTRGRTVVINLPGSPKACREGFALLAPVLRHAVSLLREEPTSHGRGT